MSSRQLLKKNVENTINAIKVFLHSCNKLSPLSLDKQYDMDALEPHDALVVRFERSVELVINKLSKSIDIDETGGSSETLRDRLNQMSKLKMISSVDLWLEMREVRNKIAHEYLPEKITLIYSDILTKYAPEIRNLNHVLGSYKQ